MDLFLFKSILAVFFLTAALISLISMLSLMGKAERKGNPAFLRTIHKISGFCFFGLLLVISYFCLKYWGEAGDQISIRAGFHSILALALIILFVIKIIIAQFYKQLLKFIPALGIIVFSLAFIVTASSAGFYLLRSYCQAPLNPGSSESASVDSGEDLFIRHCASCHLIDSEEKKIGPGLKGILQREILPSGREASRQNIRDQIRNPRLSMPAFPQLSETQVDSLIDFLENL